MTRRRLQSFFNNGLAIIVSLIMFIPVYLVLVNSFKTRAEANSMGVALPTSLNWSNFATVIDRGKLLTAFGNSVLYAVGGTVIGVTLAALAAYVLSRNRTSANRWVYFFIIMGIAMPTNFVTLMKVMQVTGLINTQIGIILLYASSSIPFSVFLIYAFVGTLPRELDEAAIVDGCGPFRLFFSIIFPLLTPVLVTAGILNLLGIWNEFCCRSTISTAAPTGP
jgi:raffinose/stachyose/melibiose transport system permease protein